jgi:hypothetical protein
MSRAALLIAAEAGGFDRSDEESSRLVALCHKGMPYVSQATVKRGIRKLVAAGMLKMRAFQGRQVWLLNGDIVRNN